MIHEECFGIHKDLTLQKLQRAAHAVPDLRSAALHEDFRGEDGAIG